MTKSEFVYRSLTTFAVAGLAISLYSHYSTNMSFTENSFDTQTGKLFINANTRFDTGNLGNLAHANDKSISAVACANEFESQYSKLLVHTSGRPIIPPGEYTIPKPCGGGLPIVKPEITAIRQEIPFDWSEPLKYIFVAGGFAGLSALILKGAKMLSAHERRTVISSFIPAPIKLTADAPHIPDPRMKSPEPILRAIRDWSKNSEELIAGFILSMLSPFQKVEPVYRANMSALERSQADATAIILTNYQAEEREARVRGSDLILFDTMVLKNDKAKDVTNFVDGLPPES